MGEVFEAVHDAIERRVAIKILSAEHAGNVDMTERFLNEARAANRVDHPSMVQIWECGRLPNGVAYIVMELLKGETLGRRVRRLRRFLSGKEILLICQQVAEGLAAAHGKGIIHRDLKPDNVMLVPDPAAVGGERAKLMDFGIAKVADPNREARAKTRTDLLLGTPSYMSPEQCRGAGLVTSKTDVYSLGVMLFRLLSGRLPFMAEGSGEMMAMHIYESPPSLASLSPWVPEPLTVLVHKLLEKNPNLRPSMSEVADELAQLAPLAAEMVTPPQSEAQPRSTESGAPGLSSCDPESNSDSDSDSLMATVDADSARPALLSESAYSFYAFDLGNEHKTLLRKRRVRVLMAAGALIGLATVFIGGVQIWRRSSTSAGPSTQSQRTDAAKGGARTAPMSLPASAAATTAQTHAFIPTNAVAASPDAGRLTAPRVPEQPSVPAPPLRVRSLIDSVPQGASVVRAADGVRLGMTPWHREQPARTGTEMILVQLPGRLDQTLELDLSANSEHRVTLPRKRLSAARKQDPQEPDHGPVPIMD